MITRSQFLARSAMMGVGAAAGRYSPEQIVAAHKAAYAIFKAASTSPAWMATAASLAKLGLAGYAVTYHPSAPPSGQQPAVAGLHGITPLGHLPGGWTIAMYDIEKYPVSQVPLAEQQDPWTYGRRFGQQAHALGLRTVWAPARDLFYVPGIAQPPNLGETVDAWYERTALAAVASWHDIYLCQSEMDAPDLQAFTAFVTANQKIAVQANPSCLVFAELSTSAGSAAQMIAAGKAVLALVAGFYLAVPDGDYAKMSAVVAGLTGG